MLEISPPDQLKENRTVHRGNALSLSNWDPETVHRSSPTKYSPKLYGHFRVQWENIAGRICSTTC